MKTMKKKKTKTKKQITNIKPLKADNEFFGFGFGSGFVGLRRWSENFGWGRVGLVYATVSRRMALAPPLPPSHRAKIFRLHPIRSKIGQPSNKLSEQSIRSLHQTMEQADGSERLCAVHAALWPSVRFWILLSHWTILSNCSTIFAKPLDKNVEL